MRALRTSQLAVVAVFAAVGCGGGGGGAPNNPTYSVQLEFPATTSDGKTSTLTDKQREAFQHAATRITQIVTAGLRTMPASSFVDKNGQPIKCKKSDADPGYTVSVDVTNLLIYVEAVTIDGPGQILGQSGPCIVRGSGLPVVGAMSFDKADLAGLESNGQLETVILHEMLHVVGFGTIWQDKKVLAGGLTSDQDPGTPHSPTFTGSRAMGAYHDVGGPASTPVPVEGCVQPTPGGAANCGAGTTDSHWRESVFDTELMTGWIDPTDPLSAVTIASLADLGYSVDLTKADPYTLPGSALRSTVAGPRIHMGNDTFTVPPAVVPDF